LKGGRAPAAEPTWLVPPWRRRRRLPAALPMFVNCHKEKSMFRVLIASVLMLVLSACNTVQGIGKDVKKGGEVIEKSAK
jgi:predicted small secreted protein